MTNFLTPFALYIVAVVSAGLLSVALPFALWYYFRAKEIAPLLTKKAALETVLENLTNDIHIAREQLDKLSDEKVAAKELIANGELAKKWLEDNQKIIEDIRIQIVKINQEYQIAKSQYDDIKEKVSSKMTELAELNTKLLAIEEKYATIAKDHKEAISKFEQIRDGLKRDVSMLSADKVSLQSEKYGLVTQVNELKDQRTELKKEIEELKKYKDKLSFEVAEYEGRKKQNEELKKEKEKLEIKLDGLRQAIADAKSLIAEANTIRNNEANMWKDLERSVAIIEKKPISAKLVNDEEVALRTFKQALDDSGYAFNERTIKAFHTGLLCGGVSPLVVLSGISGTGKSLLPELYAKAFNMNFLPVAVQPRWDGPQDVFGFYNHMEGRFKATELSRLIYQFDVFNNGKAAKMYGPSDEDQFPMSLVLLDEMNLARVEYYFSELLSKLEIRNRVIDPTIKDARKPSEIELEYGASSVADESVARSLARRLFVGHNILFVGTMNEDESTQTLSSKVIDRSNVLRFGTPESLTRAPDAKKFIEKCNNFISYKTWKNWAKPYGKSLVGLEDRISELKEALKLVDRGFGHRTESAIKQYVDFYPGSKQDALADQIEMKILPKLNGVESDLVRDKVQNMIVSVLRSIHDTDVTEALTETLNSESTFFTWKGVRR